MRLPLTQNCPKYCMGKVSRIPTIGDYTIFFNSLFFVLYSDVGAWLNDQKPIRIKKHKRPAKSVFRYGFDRIRNNLLNPQDKQEELHEILMLLWNVLMGPKHHIYQLYPLF